ncbi:GNAT family N-acetyltransferase [Ensifer sp. ENS07]|uniref:MSMEG_0567/Sll0786 family nitrogen starvation N-acetyltransferase n=1 Tax=unclassified Ensifer TaxID=2633371 RepID=UPI001785D1D7|nr:MULTISPECIES: MSMEG_0567/Sll0786 family nitrogen starvation N-acetyltransferase [unclassified Ensifer]MBD9508095.1 GNAT family N-acetyltransferase [Ensifer sp. ENS10]MBD9637409.1 GNAT family N-acetyltransferase [Ensifer sp. ENS07]
MRQVPNTASLQIKWATDDWENLAAFALRRRVFCDEQQLFEADDRDDLDENAIPLVAVTLSDGVPNEVVGTVRINEDRTERGTWWGSRLAVEQRYRSVGGVGIGKGLIRLAVSSAHARGCTRFLANVQKQNLLLFRRLHWHSINEFEWHGVAHHRMEADLAFYPPCADPNVGFFSSFKGAA